MNDEILNETAHDDSLEDEFETTAQCHALAADHFQQAAQQHMLAADAHEAGNLYEGHRRAYLAYRLQLIAVQYAEMAAMDQEEADLEDEDEVQEEN